MMFRMPPHKDAKVRQTPKTVIDSGYVAEVGMEMSPGNSPR
jgi:hypothetical protein